MLPDGAATCAARGATHALGYAAVTPADGLIQARPLGLRMMSR